MNSPFLFFDWLCLRLNGFQGVLRLIVSVNELDFRVVNASLHLDVDA